MHSIRFKITAIIIAAVLLAIAAIVAVCYPRIRSENDRRSVEMMNLIDADTSKTLELYFNSIEQSVEMVANMATDTLDRIVLAESGITSSGTGQEERTPEQIEMLDSYLSDYCARVLESFSSVASHALGVITYYYCLSPEISETEHGFFYSRVGKSGFAAREPLDARELDPEDMEHTTWYYTEKIQMQKEAGFRIVPHSVNLSRSDFDSCDIVEEIRKRVDVSGVGRDKITIEITESIIGSDFEFMKQQIHRFQNLGFSVWMDDFGSGYSTLDVLQTLRFDTLKFDMSFLNNLDENENSKIILTEMMKMATSLGVDTVCEGVETAKQAEFLREIGCSKLQGYYFSKPISYEQLLSHYEKGIQIGYENPEDNNNSQRFPRFS